MNTANQRSPRRRHFVGMLILIVLACALVPMLTACAGGTSSSAGGASSAAVASDSSASEGKGAPASADSSAQSSEIPASQNATAAIVDAVAHMTTEEKISQMIVPAVRSWDGTDLRDLSAAPELAKALTRHQYGGIILFGSNVSTVKQAATLVNDLQANNWQVETKYHIPYFMMVDGEGGIVTRLTMGTRMNGNMAIGATGANAEANARTTGRIIGEEVAAIGFNVDLAPTIDVNSNPANPVIGTRSFSDDPNLVAKLGPAFVDGLKDAEVVATVKHFPGHGDTGTDSHTSLPSVNKTRDELEACEFVPFREAIKSGAELIMTAHITLPKVDDEQTFADGSKGYYPATMSKKIINDILRGDLGFKGVVVTDALEMDAVAKGKFVPGETGSVEYVANVTEKVIDAGVDIILLPKDLNNADAAAFMDAYIDALVKKVEEGKIDEKRIDESVTRILTLKATHGISINEQVAGADISAAEKTVGSAEHHDAEMKIAREAITLLKNDAQTLPFSSNGKKLVVLGRFDGDAKTIAYAVEQLKEQGLLDADVSVRNLVSGKSSGSQDAKTRITIDYYCGFDDKQNPVAHYTDELSAAVKEADLVVCFTATTGTYPMTKASPLYQCVTRAKSEVHEGGGKFVLLSNGLPYDAARYQDADAILCSYLSGGMDMDPTERDAASGNLAAYNANVVAALEAIFNGVSPTGTLPVNIPAVSDAADGSIAFDMSNNVYSRGYGLGY